LEFVDSLDVKPLHEASWTRGTGPKIVVPNQKVPGFAPKFEKCVGSLDVEATLRCFLDERQRHQNVGSEPKKSWRSSFAGPSFLNGCHTRAFFKEVDTRAISDMSGENYARVMLSFRLRIMPKKHAM
jgi:hypothetical protein